MYRDGSYRVGFGDHLTDIAIPPKLTSIALASKNTSFASINSDEARSTEIYLQTPPEQLQLWYSGRCVVCARGGCRKVSGWGHYCYGTITTLRPGESHKHDGGVNLSVHYRSSVGKVGGQWR